MARTKATVGAKVSSGKSSKARCSVAPPPHPMASGGGERPARGHSGGNPVCPRETPIWQRPITNFFVSKHAKNDSDSDEVDTKKAGSSESESKCKLPEPDEEPPTDGALDESLPLEPLSGEDSHKIDEYYHKEKGKGMGEKSMDAKDGRTSKRRLDGGSDEDGERASKRIKVT